jgi:hypothetical protein
MPAATPAPAIVETVISMLEKLGTTLDAAGWTTRLQVTPGRAPALYVRNPEPGAAALSEHIYAAPNHDGYCDWWPWGQPIAQDIPETTTLIRRALRAAPEIS